MLQWSTPYRSRTNTTKTTSTKSNFSNTDAFKKEIMHKRHRFPTIDHRFSSWRKSTPLKKCFFNKAIARHNQLRPYIRFSPCNVGLWTYHVLSLPLADAAATSHESRSKFLIATKRLKPPLSVLRTRLPCHFLSLTSLWTVKDVFYDGNK
jgi:hypothetical protein